MNKGLKSHYSLFQIRYSSILFLILYSLFLILSPVPQAHAFTMSNGNWTVQMGNFNMSSGKPTNSNYKLGVTTGEIASGLYSGSNYKVRAGFQYIKSIIPFRFAISSLLLDFGSLTPTNPVTRTNQLTISNGSAYGYTVTAFETQPLKNNTNGWAIPDTTCDNGLCSESTSASWTNVLTYGFGYRCDNVTGTDCATFTTADDYKQFANNLAGETPQAVMTGTNVGRNKQVQITYKVNVSGTQPAGSYQTAIIYIATPRF